uniref:ribonuclease H n=1 Tax=Sphaeramia orbicularis TaxID=375764 RepID=A0A673A8H2_9TELE
PTPMLSGKTIISVSAGGKQDRQCFTVPLTCVSQECSFQHSFLLSHICPINLCGRDLMCKLGINLESGPEGSVFDCQKTVQLLNDEALTCMSTSPTGLSPVSVPPELADIPPDVWATGPHDVGLVRNCPPVIITPRSDYRPCQKQSVFEAYLNVGIIVPCPDPPVRTPIFPVKKVRIPPDPDTWRFIQDLQVVNKAVVPRVPMVPNPHTILSQIPPTASHFSVIDLSNAFTSVPVHADSQYWFAFQFKNKMYTWTHMSQGYCDAPNIYNSILADSLSHLDLPPGVAPSQYVDDLLLCCHYLSKGGMLDAIAQHWFTKGFTVVAEKFCKKCLICAAHNTTKSFPCRSAGHDQPNLPVDHLMMDFVELSPAASPVTAVGLDPGLQTKALETAQVARAFPGAPDDAHSGQGC